MKKTILILFAILACVTVSSQEKRKDRLFMPKGSIGAGIQLSYVDLGSSDSDVMMILKGLDAKGTYSSMAPFIIWNYKNNKAIGARMNLSKASASINSADLSLFSDDLSLSVEDIRADSQSYMFQVFKRSYLGLDTQGRFGLFTDLSLSYSNSKSNFSYNEETLDAFSRTKKVKLGISPGIMIFILNNVSTHVSLNIGGVSYAHTDCYKHGEIAGKRDNTKANFAPDLTGISFGMTFHL